MKKQNLKSKYAKLQIKDILMSEEKIFIPTYQRAYSWEVKNSSNENKEVAIFWEDIKSHIESEVKSNFYLGNFIFEEDNEKLGIIDGQQRLTTVILLLSALQKISNTSLTDYDLNNFSTVSYDEDDFKKILSEELLNIYEATSSTDSIKKIFNAYNFFKEKLKEIEPEKLKAIENLILESTCQINIIDDKIEAIQVFVFENNRGKTPTNLEIVKSMFMHYIYSTSETTNKDKIINEIETNFTSIYQNIAILEGKIKEDFILGVAFRIQENKLKLQGNIVTEIEKKLKVDFIRKFLDTLKDTFNFICNFIQQGKKPLEDEENYMVHSLLNLGISGEIYPIIIKAMEIKNKKLLIFLYKALEAIIIRGKIIDTSAKIYHRLEGLYKEMNDTNKLSKEKIESIIIRIDKMINSNEFAIIENEKEPNKNWWWSYWTKEKFELNLNNGIKSLGATKYILWKYENQLREDNKELKITYDKIKTYDIEHIAPKTENKEDINAGYPIYNEEFYSKYLNSFGNLILLEESINRKISNKSFKEKLREYKEDKNKLIQQRQEVLLENNSNEILWTIDKIKNRERKIKEFILLKLSLKDYIGEKL